MNQPERTMMGETPKPPLQSVVIPLSEDGRAEAALGARALWMLGVSVMVGVVVVAGLASAALAVRIAT